VIFPNPDEAATNSFSTTERRWDMRYALAVICPPLALLVSHRPYRAAVAAIFFAIAIATAGYHGLGAFLDFFLILWATNAVGDEKADLEARAFIRTVKPIPVVHE
jgi:hypothetical protein